MLRALTSRKLLAVALASLWASSAAAPLLHLSHAHRICEEHQAVEEAAPDDEQSRGAPDGQRPGRDEHQKCALLGTAPAIRAGVVWTEMLACPREGSGAGAGRVEVYEPLAVLDRAPKASPPAA